ncbi:MAG: ThiF family adenylyltransferase [Planctomycetota bacterium]
MNDDPAGAGNPDASLPPSLARYSRQILYPGIGLEGQQRLRNASATLIGCGALGSALANTLVRAGIGALRIIDRDFIEPVNLQRQTLFDEQDIAQNLPKAEAAARKLRRINSAVEVEGIVADIHPANIAALCGSADLLLDGTDNLETRYLINDFAVRTETPWVYGACLGAEGLVLAIVPHRTPCLRCIWDDPPAPGSLPTCDTAGILMSAASIVAAFQAIEALKILAGRTDALHGRLLAIDAWTGQCRALNVQAAHAADCICCQQRRYEYLEGDRFASATALCGRDAVQIRPVTSSAEGPAVSFRAIAERLPARAAARYNEYMLRFRADDFAVTLFADGRAIIQGTGDPAAARAIYAQYIGV